MIYIVLSLPLWVLGTATGMMGIFDWLTAFFKALYTEVPRGNTRMAKQGACLLLLVSCASFELAAWLCS